MKKLKVGNLFPNLDESAGFYSPTNFCITLNNITIRQFSELFKDKIGHTEKRKVLHHEVRHHLDHLSTLWGHGHILHLQQAVDARLDKDESKFHKIAKYKNSENQNHYYKYFTINNGFAKYNSSADRWEWRITSGARFNSAGELQKNKLILLMWFMPPNNDAYIRVPLTIASLLETNAIAEEIIVECAAIEGVEEKNREKARQAYVNKWIHNVIYHQKLVEYNCAVHLVANNFRISDPYEAYATASSIATVVLNLPFQLLTNIPIDKEYLKVWGDRPEDFIHEHNHGFIFFNMVYNYRECYKKSGQFNLAEFLDINRLPDQTTIEQMVVDQMQSYIQTVTEGSYLSKLFLEHLEAGLNLFKRRGLDGKRESLQQTLFSGTYAPLFVEKDSAFLGKYRFDDVYQSEEKLTYINPNEWYHLSAEVNEKMEEFYEICGI